MAWTDESRVLRHGGHLPKGVLQKIRKDKGLKTLKDAGRECGVESTLAKTYASEAAVQAAKKALEIHGACGTMMEYSVQRLFRDAMVCVSAGGTTEVGKLVMSRAALA